LDLVIVPLDRTGFINVFFVVVSQFAPPSTALFDQAGV
jgi:hypothetical protein